MDEKLHLGLTLMVVTLIAALALALTNNLTAPQIEMQKGLVVKEALSAVMEADSFKEVDGYYSAFDADGELVGKVVKVEASGYASILSALVGVDLDEKITGIDVVSQEETPGLGANVEKPSFLDQFKGRTYGELSLKKDGGEIDGITGATITSRALANGVDSAMRACLCNDTDAVTLATPDAETEASPEYESTEDVEEIIEDIVAESNMTLDEEDETE